MTDRKGLLVGFFGVAVFIAAYHLLTASGLVNTNILVPFSGVFGAFSNWYQSGRMVEDVSSSLYRVIAGSALGFVFGVSVAVLISTNRWLYYLTKPHIEFFRSVSPLAWIPFAILFFHIGDKPAIFLVFIASFFPIFTNTYMGITLTKKSLLETADMFGAGRWDKITKVYLPSSLVHIFHGLRISIGISWYVVVAAEMIGAQTGLGYVIQANKLTLQMEYVIASIMVIGVIGIVLQLAVSLLERRIIRWNR